jgi:hypothetical protein
MAWRWQVLANNRVQQVLVLLDTSVLPKADVVTYESTASLMVAKKFRSPRRGKSPKRLSLSFTGSFISAKHNWICAADRFS